MNIEAMTPDQVKEFLKSGNLEDLEGEDLVALLAYVNALAKYFSKDADPIGVAETIYWGKAEKMLKAECNKRRIKVHILNQQDILSEFNAVLASGDRVGRQEVINLIKGYHPDALKGIKEDLLAMPDAEKLYGEVIKLIDENIKSAKVKKTLLN